MRSAKPPVAEEDQPSTTQAPERLQKIMATAGLGSRRELEKRIRAGAVTINGKATELGQAAKAGDRLGFEGRTWKVIETGKSQRSLVYNKKTGEITTRSDPENRPTVFDNLPRIEGARWIAVGRLDINTSGLLLMTTDGELANAMMHPSNQVDREYACRIFGEVTKEQIEALKQGVTLDDGPANFSDIVSSGGEEGNRWYHVTILEGRNREVRRLWASQGVTVSRLKRVRYGAVFLPKRLRMGEFEELTAKDHKTLREDVGLKGLPSQLGLKAEKSQREADIKKRRLAAKRQKSTRYKNVEAKRSDKPKK